MSETATHDAAVVVHDHHPGPLEYIKVALVLAAITTAEVAVYYISGLRHILAPVLLVMSTFKFAIVGLYFMHLKFDTHLFRRLLILGIFLAMIVYAGVLVTLLNYA